MGYCMPDKRHRIVTSQFLRDVRSGVCFCPKITDIRLRHCRSPPTAEALCEYAIQALEHKARNNKAVKSLQGYLRVYGAEKMFLMHLISTYAPSHEIFQPGYVRPVKERLHVTKVDNSDGLFLKLPKLSKKALKCKASFTFTSKADIANIRHQKLL